MEKTRIFFLSLLSCCLMAMISCNDDVEDTVTEYLEWNNQNVAYFEAAKLETDEEGNRVYQVISPNWDPSSCVLMHYYKRGTGTVSPYSTSFVKVCYKGQLIDGTVFDDIYQSPDNPMTAKISSLVQGWTVAMERMHVGDSCRVIIPQNLGYGSRSQGSIKPYSTLIFDIKLMEIVRQ